MPLQIRDFVAIAALLCGAHARGAMPTLECSPEVRHQSFAGDVLFHDLMAAPGGVSTADLAFFPNAKSHIVVQIERSCPGAYVLAVGELRHVKISLLDHGVPTGRFYYQTRLTIAAADQLRVVRPAR